ncbi:uncharacterized protein [Oscarella lobularis]|uniref:uncharacterized protein isoform X2 n=1 Tax=Oscarella lobularis TaxID=121494 RepID=UPI003313C69A
MQRAIVEVAMTKLSRYCAFVFAAVLTAQCKSGMEVLEWTAVNRPSECERHEKLDLNAVGAELEFEVQNTLNVLSKYEFSIDGNKGTQWGECTVSSLADKVDYWIDLRNIYPIDRITLLSRHHYGNGAEVYVGNFSTAEKTENEKKCGDSLGFGSSPTEFDCDETYWVRYIRIRRVMKSKSILALHICEVEVYHDGYKYDLKRLNSHLFFELSDLHPGSNYRLATDGISDLSSCSQSSSIRRYGSIWMKIDLQKAYAVSKVRLLSHEPNLYRIFISNGSDFVNKTECKDSFYDYICPVLQAQHVLIVYERPQDSSNHLYRMQVCEVEVYYKPDEQPRRHPPGLPCGFPPHLPKSTMTTDWETTTYTCKDSLVPVQQTITCLSSGSWSSTLRKCKQCPELRHPVHGDVSLPSDLIKGATAKYSCAACYEMDGDEKRQCQAENNGNTLKWSGSEPACKVVHCGEAPIVETATLKVVSKTCGGVASYKCVGERTLFGSPHLLCGPQGKWLGTVPKCVDIPRY